jgi:hypothetical protein
MKRDGGRYRDESGGAPAGVGESAAVGPGKRSRTRDMVAPTAAADAWTSRPLFATSVSDAPMPPPVDGGLGEAFAGFAVQRKASGADDDGATPAVATGGVSSAGSPLPYLDTIQAAFGEHDLRAVRAHTDDAAADASDAMGATAYAMGDHVAFAGTPDLHTTAHEAAHVVQQRRGVQLKGGVGAAGDIYEREADAVADRVVAGESAAPLLSAYPLRSGAATTAVQRQEAPAAPGAASPAAEPATAIDTPVPGDNRPGFIDSDDGSNIRTRPAELAGSSTLTDAPLPPATRVFVSGKHPETDQWLYVTAISPSTGMVRGYVQGFRVNTDLPEPTAKLYQIKSGDTAEQLAVQEFSSAVRDGHDLRYYENVLLHVNRQHGRAGVRGSFQDPGLLGGGANNVQLEAGRRIWLVSPAYARALEGVVPDGSLTNGAYAKAKRFVGHLEDILASVTGSYQYLDDVAGEYAQAIHDHIVEIVGIVSAFIMAEALSAFLATTPTGVGQIAAVVIQLGLAAFGAVGLVEASIQALQHAQQWLTLAWTASGKDEVIAAASKEFLKMLVSIAMAALAYLGVKGNYGQATKIASNLPPPMLPAFAVVGGGERAIGGGSAGAAVAAGAPGPWGVFGAFAAVMKDPKGEGGGSAPATPESLQVRAKNLPYRAKQLRDAAEALPDSAPQKWEMLADARALEQEAAVLRELAGESAESAASLKAEIEGFEGRLQQLDDTVTKAKPVVGPATTLPRPDLPHPQNHLPVGGDRPYVPPRQAGNPDVVRHPEGNGYLDAAGNRWEWAKDQHAGPHWDVQHPDGTHTNVYPDGIVHQGADNF